VSSVPRVFSPVAQTTQVEVRYTIDNAESENVFHYKWNNTTPPSIAELISLANEVEATIAVKLRAMTGSGWQYRETYVKNIHAQPADQTTISSSLAGFPRTGDTLPGSVSDWITKRSGQTGRSQHGGINISGFVEGDVTQKIIQSALINLLLNLMLSFLAARVNGRFIPAIASHKNHTSAQMRAMISRTVRVNSAKTRLTE